MISNTIRDCLSIWNISHTHTHIPVYIFFRFLVSWKIRKIKPML